MRTPSLANAERANPNPPHDTGILEMRAHQLHFPRIAVRNIQSRQINEPATQSSPVRVNKKVEDLIEDLKAGRLKVDAYSEPPMSTQLLLEREIFYGDWDKHPIVAGKGDCLRGLG